MQADKIVKLMLRSLGGLRPRKISNPPFDIPLNALVVFPRFIGDAILLIPLLRNLRYNFGEDVNIDIVCNKDVFNLVETLPFINNAYVNEIDAKNKISFLKKNDYDTVFLFNLPVSWACASYVIGINQRISFNLTRIGSSNNILWDKLITHFIKSTSVKNKKHQLNVYLDTLKMLSLNTFDNHLEVNFTEKDIFKAEYLMENIQNLKILIHTKAGSPGKEWAFDKWVSVIKYLDEKYKCSFISTGIESEKDYYDRLAEKAGVSFYNYCGQTTLRETIALYKHLDLVITLDTAPAHLAALAKTKNIIVIYGPTNQDQWAPKTNSDSVHQVFVDLPCRPCVTRLCKHKDCLTKINPELVKKVIDKLDFGIENHKSV